MGYEVLNGVGKSPDDDWDGELSILVLNIDKDTAASIGKKFKQNAIVWCDLDAVPQLILLR